MPRARRLTKHCAWSAMLLVALAALAGCSAKSWYAGLQTAAENECRRLPPGETPGCLARVNKMSYEDYERQRSGRNP
jgi:hypothetical protein